uniref:Tumor necrosis factor alpha-induced protein 8-like protein n=1 Tax=Strongyloides papillosus TaxID=174720 RepID=A0A0N5BKX6_STREA
MPVEIFLTPSRVAKKRTESSNSKNETSTEKDGRTFSSASLSVRAQKKIVGKISNRKMVKVLTGSDVNNLFDELYRALKIHYNQNCAEKVIKYIIKISLKLFVVEQEGAINPENTKLFNSLEKIFKNFVLTFISFNQVDFSYDRNYIAKLLDQLQNSATILVDTYLSDKSSRRCDFIFEQINNPLFLDNLFKGKGEIHNALLGINKCFEVLIDTKQI